MFRERADRPLLWDCAQPLWPFFADAASQRSGHSSIRRVSPLNTEDDGWRVYWGRNISGGRVGCNKQTPELFDW